MAEEFHASKRHHKISMFLLMTYHFKKQIKSRDIAVEKIKISEMKFCKAFKNVNGALNTTISDVKEFGKHVGTHHFAVQCLLFELLISED